MIVLVVQINKRIRILRRSAFVLANLTRVESQSLICILSFSRQDSLKVVTQAAFRQATLDSIRTSGKLPNKSLWVHPPNPTMNTARIGLICYACGKRCWSCTRKISRLWRRRCDEVEWRRRKSMPRRRASGDSTSGGVAGL